MAHPGGENQFPEITPELVASILWGDLHWIRLSLLCRTIRPPRNCAGAGPVPRAGLHCKVSRHQRFPLHPSDVSLAHSGHPKKQQITWLPWPLPLLNLHVEVPCVQCSVHEFHMAATCSPKLLPFLTCIFQSQHCTKKCASEAISQTLYKILHDSR